MIFFETIMKPITIWQRENKREDGTKVFEHNHIEDGHVIIDQKLPTPICEIHKTLWKAGNWIFIHAYLTDDMPPKVYEGLR